MAAARGGVVAADRDPRRCDDQLGGVDVVASAPVSGGVGDQSGEETLDQDAPGELIVLGQDDELQEGCVGPDRCRSAPSRLEPVASTI